MQRIGVPKFQQKFILPFLIMLVVLAGILGSVTIHQEGALLEEELSRRSVEVVRSLSRQSQVGLLLGDREALLGIAQQIKQNDQDIIAVGLFNPRREVVAATDSSLNLPADIGKTVVPLGDPMVYRLVNHTIYIMHVLDRAGHVIGFSRVDVSRQRIAKALRQTATRTICAILLVFLTVFLIAFLLLKEILRLRDQERDMQAAMARSERLVAIGQLASGVGHELRNPLGALRNAVYYLRDSLKDSSLAKEDPSLLEFLGLADREIQSATRIISDLLDFSRDPQLLLHSTDINALLREAKSLVEMSAHIQVVEDYRPDLPMPMADQEKMRQVFINLIQNAVQAMPKGGRLDITSKLEGSFPAAEAPVLVEIRDTGVGISEENLNKIFEPLFTTKAKGTGLGLPISLGIVKKHGGRITVHSKEGEGCTFAVTLPRGASEHVG